MNKNVNSSRTQLLSVRMPHELVARMKEHTRYSGQTTTQLLADAVAYYLDNHTPMEDLLTVSDETDEEDLDWGERPFEIRPRGLYREGGRGI